MDTHDDLCIHSQSGSVLVITTSMLFCIARSHLPHNALHSPSILNSLHTILISQINCNSRTGLGTHGYWSIWCAPVVAVSAMDYSLVVVR